MMQVTNPCQRSEENAHSGRHPDWWLRLGLFGMLACATAGIYVAAVSLHKPPNWSPFDPLWAAFYVALLSGISLLAWIRPRLLVALALFAVAALTAVTAVTAGVALAYLMLLWLLALSAVLGDWFLNWLVPSLGPDLPERLLLGTSMGLGALALATLALAIFRLLYPAAAYALLGGLTLLLLPRVVHSARRRLPGWLPSARAAWRQVGPQLGAMATGCLAVCLLGSLVWAIAPSIHYDALVYHLSVPATYVQQHALVEIPGQFRSYWAHNGEMLYTLALMLVGQPLPSLLHMAFGLLSVGFVLLLGWRVAGARAALVAALFFFSLPIVTWESGIAYTDLMVSLYTLASLYGVVRWWSTQQDDWLVISGVMGGLAVGIKLSAELFLVPLSVLIVRLLAKRYGPTRRCAVGLLRFTVPMVVLAAPWLLRDWLWTGNPVFPFFTSIFHSSKWGRQTVGFASYREGWDALGALRLPWGLVFRPQAFDIEATSGWLGAIPLLALPWQYLGRWPHRRPAIALSALAATAVIVWLGIAQQVRYLLPVFPMLALLAAMNVEALWLRFSQHPYRKWMVMLGVAVLCLYLASTRVAHAVGGWQIPERYPYRLALGLEDSGHFLSRAVAIYDAFQFLEEQENGRSRTLAVATDQSGLYTVSDIVCLHSCWELRTLVPTLRPDQSLAAELAARGFDHLLVDYNGIRAWPERYAGLPVLDEAFLGQFARLEFARHNVRVYRLLPAGSGRTEAQELLANASFEQMAQDGTPQGWSHYGQPIVDATGSTSHSGRVAVQVSGAAGLYQQVAVEPGGLYIVGHWTRADREGQLARLQINWLDERGRLVDVSIDVVPVSSEWRRNEMPATAPPDAAFAEIHVNPHGGEVWFDDIRFARVGY